MVRKQGIQSRQFLLLAQGRQWRQRENHCRQGVVFQRQEIYRRQTRNGSLDGTYHGSRQWKSKAFISPIPFFPIAARILDVPLCFTVERERWMRPPNRIRTISSRDPGCRLKWTSASQAALDSKGVSVTELK